jgi:hypothetical protein
MPCLRPDASACGQPICPREPVGALDVAPTLIAAIVARVRGWLT